VVHVDPLNFCRYTSKSTLADEASRQTW